MEKGFYIELRQLFNKFHDLYESEQVNPQKVSSVLGELRFAHRQVKKNGNWRERKLLLYCIESAIEVAKENDKQKTADLAAILCGIPDIFLGKRNLRSFKHDFRRFRDQYGQQYLAGIEDTYPRFLKGIPKNAKEYFLPSSDKEFKTAHPRAYPWIVTLGIIALFLPMLTFVVVTLIILKLPESVWLLLAEFGCFIIGIGLFNLVSALLDQYLGHFVTVASVFVGVVITSIGLSLAYFDDRYHVFNQNVLSLSGVSFVSLLLCAIYYIEFRYAVHFWLQKSKGLDASRIKKYKKGRANYWWYEGLHREYDLGVIYYFNKWFTISEAISLILIVLLGCFRFAAPFIAISVCLTTLLMMSLFCFSRIQTNKEQYGVCFVLLRRAENKRIDSVFLDFIGLVVLFVFFYSELQAIAFFLGFSIPKLWG